MTTKIIYCLGRGAAGMGVESRLAESATVAFLSPFFSEAARVRGHELQRLGQRAWRCGLIYLFRCVTLVPVVEEGTG